MATFNIATAKGPHPTEGEPMRLMVGNTRVEFFVNSGHGLQPMLTHRASGMSLGSLSGLKLGAYVGSGVILNNRKAAQRLLNSLVDQFGEEKLLAKFNSAPVIN